MISRIAMALIALCALALPAATMAADRVVIAQPFDALIWAPIYVARGKGYFKAENLDAEVVLVKGGPAAVTAVLTGSADFALGNPGATMLARQNGQAVQVVALLCNQVALSLMVRTDVATARGLSPAMAIDDRLKALKGMTIAVNGAGSVADQVLRHAARHAGLIPERDLTITPIESHAAAVAAIEQKRIDGFVQGPPASEMIASGGKAVALVDFIKGEYAPLRDIAYVTLSAGEAWAAKNPDLARRTLRAVARALVLMQDDPAAAKEAVRPFFPALEPAVFDQSWQRVLPAYTRSPRVDGPSLALNAQLTDGKPLTIDIDRAFTNAYLD